MSQVVVDASGAVFALTNLESAAFDDGGTQVINIPLYDMVRFAQGPIRACKLVPK